MPTKPITYEEFVKKYDQREAKWNFNAFEIRCIKCSSTDVEFGGATKLDYGYYGTIAFEGAIIVKCHSCGNAMTLSIGKDAGSSDFCSLCDK